MWSEQLIERYIHWLPSYLPVVLAGAVIAAVFTWRRDRIDRPTASALVSIALVVGLWDAWQRMSLFDDAFISLHYADNLLSGNGLVYNLGDTVLGITNIGWTALLALGSFLTRIELPQIALIACGLAYIGLVAATLGVSRAWSNTRFPPLAAIGVATSWLVCSFASTGLESLAIVTFGVFGLLQLMRGRWAWAGLLFTLGAILRLDQGLLLGIGFLIALREGQWRPYLRATPLLGALLLFCTAYYGHPLPNTVAAKASGAYFSQGGFYILTYLLTTQLIWMLPLALWGLIRSDLSPAQRRFRAFVGGMLVLWPLYIGYVGGDFMLGRFMLPTLPLIFLAAEAGARSFDGWKTVIAGALIGATAYGLPILHPKSIEWYLADEGSVYPVKTLVPFAMKHHTYKIGKLFKRIYVDRGLEPVVAAHGIGMIGYYSHLPQIIDPLGLTDTYTATKKLDHRGRPGHERSAGRAHLLSKGVILSSRLPFPGFEHLTRIRVSKELQPVIGHWHLFRYERAKVEELQRVAPEIGFVDIEKFIKRFTRELADKPTPHIRRTLDFLDSFYFSQPGAHQPLRAPIAAELEDRQARSQLEAIGYVAGEDEIAAYRSGVVTHDPERSQPGLNLVTSADGPTVRLLDDAGKIRHSWTVPFATAFPQSTADSLSTRYIRRAHAFPDGRLAVIFEGEGIAMVDRDSKLLWARANRAHHDLVPGPDGTLWTLIRHIRKQTPYGRPLIEDELVQLGPEGEELQRHSVFQAVYDSPSRPLLDALVSGAAATDGVRTQESNSGDVLHTNAIQLLGDKVLLSSRPLSALFIMDLQSGAIERTIRGDFDGQHDPHLREDGSIVLFDNGLERSRVLEISPSGETVWEWSRPGFYTRFCGTAQPLANGNILATESLRGTAVELSPEGEVVWEFHTPWSAVDDPNKVANLLEVERMPPGFGEGWISVP